MSTLFDTASEIVKDAVDSPLTVLRKLGLNVPSKSDISTGVTTIAKDFSPAADIKEMVEGSEKISEGNPMSGIAQLVGGAFGAAIPFSGRVRATGKVMGKELDKGISRFVKDGEVGEDEFLSSGKLLKNYTTKEQNILNSLVDKATAGSKSKNKKINAFIEEGTPVGGRLNLSSKITDAPAGLDKLQTVHSKNFRGGVLGYEPVTTVVAPKGGKVKFNVGQSNRERIASGKDTKHPAASVDGLYTSKFNLLDDPEAIEIGFNPKMHHLFIDLKTGQAVKDADAATMIGDRVYAKGVSYFKQTKSPNPISSSTVKYKEKNMGGQIMPMQYGGGLDDTYLNMSRRRSNAFADPNANTAFASPMSISGLPTIYRYYGGATGDASASDVEDGEGFENVDFGNPETGAPTMSVEQMIGVDIPDIEDDPRTITHKAKMSPVAYDMIRQEHEDKLNKEGYDRWQTAYLNDLIGKGYDINQAQSMLVSAMATTGGISGMKAGFKDGYSYGGAAGTLQDLLEKGTNVDLGVEEFFKNKKKPKEKEGIEGLYNKVLDIVSLTRDISPENIKNLNNVLAQGAKFTPNNKFMAGVVSTAVPTLAKVGISALGGEKTVGTIETRDGLSYQVGDRGGLTLNMPNADIDYGHDAEVKEEEEVVKETLPDTPEEVSSMDINRSLEKKSIADPNVEIIMKMYNLTEEEANKWLGNKG